MKAMIIKKNYQNKDNDTTTTTPALPFVSHYNDTPPPLQTFTISFPPPPQVPPPLLLPHLSGFQSKLHLDSLQQRNTTFTVTQT